MAKSRKTRWILLLSLVAIIKLLSFWPSAVERYYSAGIYPWIARFQRLLFGWLPFSFGDLFYAAAIVWLVYGLVTLIRRIVRRQVDRRWGWGLLKNTGLVLLTIYCVFNLSWGLNYDRKGISDQLDLSVKPYSNQELQSLVRVVVVKLNVLDSQARIRREALQANKYWIDGAIHAYGGLSAADNRFAYPLPSIKPSLFSTLDNYLGFYGYYNPFTGEAQVNTAVPSFTLPFTACHEIGHQLGYAKENEANFAGFLAARSNPDPNFLYSVYFDMYHYAARELYMRDSTLLVPLRESLHPAVRKDSRDLAAFNRQYDNIIEPVVRQMYGGYLRANRQPQGMKTYNEVVAWLVAYGRKYGWEKI